jgi:hypothetical protein
MIHIEFRVESSVDLYITFRLLPLFRAKGNSIPMRCGQFHLVTRTT